MAVVQLNFVSGGVVLTVEEGGTLIMLTIRKKLAEQAATGAAGKGGNAKGEGSRLARKLSFRSQLLSSEANELGEIIPSKLLGSFIG